MKIEGLTDKKKVEPMKNFLLISLEEKKAKKIAEAINNETGRKILDSLAKKAYTETELSKELGIAISTVHYNLKQLQEADLVVVDEFHYSPKGKEVNHYSLANKYIIIAPKNSDSRFLEALKKIIPLTIITVGVAAVMQFIQMFNFNSYKTAAPVSSFAQDSAVNIAATEAVNQGAGASAKMLASPQAATLATESSRPIMQSNVTAYFLIGALAIIIIYFLYEFVKKND